MDRGRCGGDKWAPNTYESYNTAHRLIHEIGVGQKFSRNFT